MSTPGFTRNGPTSNNLLKETGFSFACSFIPDTVYHLQSANLPGVSGNAIPMQTPLTTMNVPGDQLEYEPLNITFLVDEEMANYRKMYDWMKMLYTAENTADFPALINQDFLMDTYGGGITDATLTVRSNKHNPTVRVQYQDLFPTSLGELQFTTASTDAEDLVCTASFSYTGYKIDYLSS